MKPSSRSNPFLKPEKQSSSLSPLQRRILQEKLAGAGPMEPSAVEHTELNIPGMLSWFDPLQHIVLNHMPQEQGDINLEILCQALFNMKMDSLVALINYHHGARLYQMTQNCRGKTWIVCSIASEDFVRGPPAIIPVRITVSDAIYADERSPELLQMLIDMPADRYMLAFEVLSTERPSILSNHVVDPLAIDAEAPLKFWHFNLRIIELRMISNIVKVVCNICNKVAPAGFSFSYCSGCHEQRYCSQECQKTDWISHRTRCALLRILHDTRAQAST